MIIKQEERRTEAIKEMKGGTGTFFLRHFVDSDILGKAGRLFAHGVLEPGSSVGWHVHERDMEICCFLSGCGRAKEQDGKWHEISAGDVQICLQGNGHEIVNTGSEPLTYIVLVCYPEG